MKTYAIPEKVPDDIDYLTAGKRYEVTEILGGLFAITDDDGDRIDCQWEGSAHLNGGNWTRVDDAWHRPLDQDEATDRAIMHGYKPPFPWDVFYVQAAIFVAIVAAIVWVIV
jgi:hypothetical protein